MKKLVLFVILGAVVTASIWSWKRTAEPVDANRLVADRIWIDHIPRNERDTINVFAAVSEHSIGVFQATSQWRGAFEAFRYEANGGELRLFFPQTGDRERARAKARRCSEQQMDFCLEIEGASRGVKKYYSREGWEIGQARDLDAVKQRVEAVRDKLAPAE
ncbi:MAG TPA: hypothetical protein VGD80_38680 [Kofleriaceae bacterium]